MFISTGKSGVSELEKEIAKQAEELKNAPVVPVLAAIVGRCHVCGQIADLNDLQPYDTHIPHGPQRKACKMCHPHRQVPAIAAHPSNEKALFWNPAGASFEQALAVLGTSWTVMTFSTWRGRPMCDCPVGGRSFLRCPRGLRRKCLQAMASTAACGRCLIRQKAWQSLAGNVRQSPTDKAAGV